MAKQWPVVETPESVPTKTTSESGVDRLVGSLTRFSYPPLPTAFTRPASCDSRDLTWVSTNAGTVLQRNLIYQSFQGSTLVTAGTECFPPGFQWTESDAKPFYFSPGACPSGYSDGGGTTVQTSGSLGYEAFCCPTSFKSYGNGCWSAMTDLNRPITEVVLQTTTSVVGGTTTTGVAVNIISMFTQSPIFDNQHGVGPFKTGFPVYEYPVRVRTSTGSTFNTLHPRSLSHSKHVGVLPLAAFVGLMIGVGILLCCCLCICAGNSGGSSPSYAPPPPARSTRRTTSSRPARSTYNPRPVIRDSRPSHSLPVRVERPAAAVKKPAVSSGPVPSSYPPVRK